MITILTDETSHQSTTARLDADGVWLKADEMPAATGWALKPEGFCKGDVCMPIPPARADEFVRAAEVATEITTEINVARLWQHLGAPVVRDAAGESWVLGTSAEARAKRLQSLEAPDFALRDLQGRQHALSSYRGRKVLLVSWASW